MIDLKGLMGDSAGNYLGVRGIGEKTALKLLQKYGSTD
ncbi:5'-3' exonuclease H3TH domain-containing protein [Aeribacillus composti]|nr:5'-3' exonuclease H3TH domain-containing protein [Aeribacillus composti]